MEKLELSPKLGAELRELETTEEGLALMDENGHWIGVALNPTSYRLLRAAADLGSDPDAYEQVHADNMEFKELGPPGQSVRSQDPPEEPEAEYETPKLRF